MTATSARSVWTGSAGFWPPVSPWWDWVVLGDTSWKPSRGWGWGGSSASTATFLPKATSTANCCPALTTSASRRPRRRSSAQARINPAVEFTGRAVPFEDLGEEFLRDCRLAFDCLDSIPARRVLAERCTAAGVVLVHGAIAGWCGQVGICPPGSDMLEKIYAGEKRGIEQQLGNLPFTAAVAANLMVARAIPLLLGRQGPSRPRLQFFDLLEGDWETIEF